MINKHVFESVGIKNMSCVYLFCSLFNLKSTSAYCPGVGEIYLRYKIKSLKYFLAEIDETNLLH